MNWLTLRRRCAHRSFVVNPVVLAGTVIGATSLLGACANAAPTAPPPDDLKSQFVSPPETARPWVYWYFMDGNVTREGLRADLEAMKKAGIGGAIYLEVDIGVPRGPVAFMSPQWQQNFAYAVSEAKRLGIQIALGTGPGWTGSGGPWVKPELSMQDLVSSETSVAGPTHFDAELPRPKPKTPFFGDGTLTPELRAQWQNFYRDEFVLAFPTPEGNARLADTDHTALYYRAPYSSGTVAPRIPAPVEGSDVPAAQTIPTGQIVVLSDKIDANGRLQWDVPPGKWTIMRFGRTLTGQTTRPAPLPGLGFESDKFSTLAVDEHLKNYTGKLFDTLGPNYRSGDSGLTMLHFDSWEMSSQNWSPDFRREFTKRRGYDPTPFLPAISGYVVESRERSERFLWDLRQTASELVVENHAMRLRDYAHQHGLTFSVEPYDLNPSADLDLGATADLPMCEFWSRGFGFSAEYSCYEATSIGHTNGRKIIGAESFTANPGEDWRQYPGSMKAQLDWALCTGINKFVIHRYQHQPDPGKFPGMSMGPYGVHWESTETWWDMVPAFHKYMTRTSQMLRQGLPVADVLYLTPEGAPQVFTPPTSALTSGLPDRKGYNFDGCSPKTLIERASAKNGNIVFPDGTSYHLLVLPDWPAMTPELLGKITQLVEAGATIAGAPPSFSPSLTNYPAADTQLKTLAAHLWGQAPYAPQRKVGQGRVIYSKAGVGGSLNNAKWIWFNEGNPASSAPATYRYFRTSVAFEPAKTVKSAFVSITADNEYDLFVNDHHIGHGDNFHNADLLDIAPFLKPGTNDIRVTALNTGGAPGPAGLIGSIQISFADGTQKTLDSGASWEAAQTESGPWSPALELGPVGMGPWGLTQPEQIYPSYPATASMLASMKVAPDFSSGEPMRFIHRRLPDGELYFIGNATESPIDTTATFRVAGRQPQWWNPITGETRALTNYKAANGLTTIPVSLAPSESGFVIFRGSAGKPTPTQPNFPTYRTLTTLSNPWQVAFDPKWGAPASLTFTTLDDWTTRSEPDLKHYSGKATYTTTFDLPNGTRPASTKYRLSLGVVKNLATVKVNGHDLGIVWCDPWVVTVPTTYLKPTGNQLEVTVANLWINRLIGDSGKPQEQRLTQTTYNPYNPNSPLQPSGLLGPVTVQTSAK